VEGGGLGEVAEVAVAGDERNAGVHTVLCYQGIGEAGFAAFSQGLGAESSGSLPKTGFDLEQGHIREAGAQGRRKSWVAQELREDDRHHHQLTILQRFVQEQGIVASGTIQKRNPGAGVRGDHCSIIGRL